MLLRHYSLAVCITTKYFVNLYIIRPMHAEGRTLYNCIIYSYYLFEKTKIPIHLLLLLFINIMILYFLKTNKQKKNNEDDPP